MGPYFVIVVGVPKQMAHAMNYEIGQFFVDGSTFFFNFSVWNAVRSRQNK